MISLNTLREEDIQEKIDLNNKDGIDIYKLRNLIEEELKDFEWVALRAQVQCQCYKEQLQYINRKINEMEKSSIG